VPGDKSISHRALLLAALADGSSRFWGVSPGHDVAATASCLRGLGVDLRCTDAASHTWQVAGLALESWRSPQQALDCGNSGTTMRLLCGILAGAPGLCATLTGDASLLRRPMRRVAEPLRAIGARVAVTAMGTAPLHIAGCRLSGGSVQLTVPSAQVKSALLLAGLAAEATVEVRQSAPTRDHTERMLAAMGAHVDVHAEGVAVGPGALRPLPPARVPGDPSAAAFAVALAVLHSDAEVAVAGVCLNPRRTGWLRVLQRMGAAVEVVADPTGTTLAGEPSGTLVARSSDLHATDLRADEVTDCVDEVPILALCMAAARGTSTLHGLGELRVKESDRLAATAGLLAALGVAGNAGADWLRISGRGGAGHFSRLCAFDPGLDHRMALCAAVAGLCGRGVDHIANWSTTATSWPGFAAAVGPLDRSG